MSWWTTYYSHVPDQYKKYPRTTFDSDLNNAKRVLNCNQYPPSRYNPLIRTRITRIIQPESGVKYGRTTCPNSAMLFLQYRGILNVNIVFTTRKLRSILPILNCFVPTHLKSHVIFEITCTGCSSQYAGQTEIWRHVARFSYCSTVPYSKLAGRV